MGSFVSCVVGVDLGVAQVGTLPDAALTARVVELEQLARRTEAALAATIAEADRRQLWASDGHRSARGWLLTLTNSSPTQATNRLRTARLVTDVACVAEAFTTGAVGTSQVHELARLHHHPRCAEQLPASIDVLVHQARTLPYTDFCRVTQRWEQLADADGAHRDHQHSHDGRNARIIRVGTDIHLRAHGGTATGDFLQEVLAAYEQAEFHTDWANTKARHGADATADQLPRTPAQRRYDALHHIFINAALPGNGHPPVPHVNILIDQATFEAGLTAIATGHNITDIPHTNPPTSDPPGIRNGPRCETSNGHPIDPLDAVAAALIGHVRRVVLNGAGVTINFGRRRRLFTGPARAAALLGYHQCCWPGCQQHPRHTDHTTPYSGLGPTDQTNSDPICAWHNRWRHQRHFTPERQPNGTWRIKRPDGTYLQQE